jgi:hypothetical protein
MYRWNCTAPLKKYLPSIKAYPFNKNMFSLEKPIPKKGVKSTNRGSLDPLYHPTTDQPMHLIAQFHLYDY